MRSINRLLLLLLLLYLRRHTVSSMWREREREMYLYNWTSFRVANGNRVKANLGNLEMSDFVQ